MDKCEILVHITASTSARDDAKYRAQAAAIVDFCSPHEENTSCSFKRSLPVSHVEGSTNSDCGSTLATGACKSPNQEFRQTSSQSVKASTTTSERPKSLSLGEARLDQRPKAPAPNLVSLLNTTQTRFQVLRTPEPLRPKTAPASSESFPTPSGFEALISDPSKARTPVSQKRSLSETDFCSFETPLSAMPGSLGSLVESVVSNSALKGSRNKELNRTNSSEAVGCAKRLKLDQFFRTGDILSDISVENEHYPRSTYSSFGHAFGVPSSAPVATPGPTSERPCDHPASQQNRNPRQIGLFVPYRDYDWTSSSSSSENDESIVNEDDSTTSASQFSHPHITGAQPYSQRLKPNPKPWQQPSPIDLTSSVESPSSTPNPAITSRGLMFYESICPPTIPDSIQRSSVFELLRNLPTYIAPPPPPTGDRPFTSQVTTVLKTITTRAPIAQYFRPISVMRDLHATERGYWALPLTIVRDAGLNEGRDNIVWHWHDFEEFYRNLQKHIASGRSGWSVRAFLEMPSIPRPFANRDRRVCVTLKVTCYAEVLPHIFLLLYILSDKRIGKMGICWFVANHVVVRMGRDGREGDARGMGASRGETVYRGKIAWGSKGKGFFGALEERVDDQFGSVRAN